MTGLLSTYSVKFIFSPSDLKATYKEKGKYF